MIFWQKITKKQLWTLIFGQKIRLALDLLIFISHGHMSPFWKARLLYLLKISRVRLRIFCCWEFGGLELVTTDKKTKIVVPRPLRRDEWYSRYQHCKMGSFMFPAALQVKWTGFYQNKFEKYANLSKKLQIVLNLPSHF